MDRVLPRPWVTLLTLHSRAGGIAATQRGAPEVLRLAVLLATDTVLLDGWGGPPRTAPDVPERRQICAVFGYQFGYQ